MTEQHPPFLFNSGIMLGTKGPRHYVEILHEPSGIGLILFISSDDVKKETYCETMKKILCFVSETLEDIKKSKEEQPTFIA